MARRAPKVFQSLNGFNGLNRRHLSLGQEHSAWPSHYHLHSRPSFMLVGTKRTSPASLLSRDTIGRPAEKQSLPISKREISTDCLFGPIFGLVAFDAEHHSDFQRVFSDA